MTLDEKIKKIADYYGLEVQLNRLAEECAEYAAARLKYQWYFDRYMYAGDKSPSTLAAMNAAEKECEKELSDVFTVVSQFKVYMRRDSELKQRILKNMEFKVDRQLKRIEQEQYEAERLKV